MNPILLVENEAYLRDLYSDELKDAGFNVRSVSSGKEALDWVRKERPQCIVLEIVLPDINGLQVLQEVKAYDKTIPVIINSAYAVYKSDFVSWMADDYVVKSSDISELLGKIKRYANRPRPRLSLATT